MDEPVKPAAGDRLAKVIARAGLCSRRDAEGWIKDGRVAVNGNVIRTPAFNVTERDKIAVDGRPLAVRETTRLWLYHKPAGLVVTERDPEGRPTVFAALEELGLPRVMTVGRLDINTEGLLLLTNDGGLKRVLELPATGWLRRYRVRAHGAVTQPQLDQLKQGMTIEGVNYGPIEATLERDQGSNVWLLVALREGKNREVKTVLGALGLEVNRLIRVSFGPFQLGELPEGKIELIKSRILKDQLGTRLANEAGVDLEERPPRPVEPQAFTKTPRPRKIHYEDGRKTEFEEKTYGKRPKDGAPGTGKPGDKKPYGDKKSFGDKKPYGEKKAFGDKPKSFGDRKPYAARADGDRKSFGDRPAGDRKPYGAKPAGDRKPYADRTAGDRKPYGAKPAGDRKPYASKPAGDRRPPSTDRKPRSDGPRPPARGGPRPPRRP